MTDATYTYLVIVQRDRIRALVKVIHGSQCNAVFHLDGAFDVDIVANIARSILILILLVFSLVLAAGATTLSSISLFFFLAALFEERVAVVDIVSALLLRGGLLVWFSMLVRLATVAATVIVQMLLLLYFLRGRVRARNTRLVLHSFDLRVVLSSRCRLFNDRARVLSVRC